MEYILQPYDWRCSDVNGQCYIRVWCHKLDTSEKVLVPIRYNPVVIAECKFKTVQRIKRFIRETSDTLAKAGNKPVKVSLQPGKELYYYTDKTTNFIKFELPSMDAMRHCQNLLRKKKTIVYEQKISPIIKYLTEQNQTFCQWIKVTGRKRDTFTDKVPEIWPTKIELLDSKDDNTRRVYPIAMAFDIEVYSENHNVFPNSSFALNACYMISIIVKKLGTDEEPRRIMVTSKHCDDIEGVEVINVKHELEVIEKFCDLVNEINPTILTGYNIFGFDIPYMNTRLEIFKRAWPSLSLMRDEETEMRTIGWSSSAYKSVSINYLNNEGRVFVDMHLWIQRQYPGLTDHKLDTVAMHFLGHGKNPVTVKEMFEVYRDGNGADMARVAEYCIVDSALCINLMEKLNTWIQLVETSSIVNVSIQDLFMRGQQIRVLNMIYRRAHEEGFILNERKSKKSAYKGAYVVEPKIGLHENVLIFDFASLYPSIIIAYNICYTTLATPHTPDEITNTFEWEQDGIVHRHRFVKREVQIGVVPAICEHLLNARKAVRAQMKGDISEFAYNILDARQNGLKISANSVYGALGAGETGKIPLIEGGEVITAKGRDLINESMKWAEDNHGAEIIYGDTDSIMINLGTIEEIKAKFELPDAPDGHVLMRAGKILEEEINPIYMKPLRLEYEGACKYIFNLTKKRYAKLMYSSAGVPESKLEIKGLPCVRRDNSKWVRDQYYSLLECIINGGTFSEAKQLVRESVEELRAGNVPDDDLVITARMSGAYSPGSTYTLKVFGDITRDLGYPVNPRERFSYIIAKRGTKKCEKMRLYEEVYKNRDPDDDGENIDYEYYIQKVAGGNIDRLLYVAYCNGKTREHFEIDCECGEPSVVVNSPCGHKCYCLDCIDEAVACRMCNRKLLKRFCSAERTTDYTAGMFKFMRKL